MQTVKFSPETLKGATESRPSALYSSPDVVWAGSLPKEKMDEILSEAREMLLGMAVVTDDPRGKRYLAVKEVSWHTKYGNQLWFSYVAYVVGPGIVELDRSDSTDSRPVDPYFRANVATLDELTAACRKALDDMLP